MTTYFDDLGRSYALAGLIGEGGEGRVFHVAERQDIVVKLYTTPPSDEKISKLRAMVELRDPSLEKFAAWPVAVLSSRSRSDVVGIAMPRVGGHPIHELYTPSSREKHFPRADWAFLIRVALNCAIAFETLHERGHVVGDVNQGNILVDDRAVAHFIDCDSFQIQCNGHKYVCEVGVAHFTPPELQRTTNFREVVRTTNHDCFGLAVTLFHLLFMGRHPFAGRFLGGGEMSLERAIEECRFAYGREAANLQMAAPKHTAALWLVGSRLGALFERAFSRASTSAGRPLAKEWREELQLLERKLLTCHSIPTHRYFVGLTQCPWCHLASSGAPDFFFAASVSAEVPDLHGNREYVEKLWARLVIASHVPKEPPPYTRQPVVGSVTLEEFSERARVERVIPVVAWCSLASLLLIYIDVRLWMFALPLCGIFWVWSIVLRMTSPVGKERRRLEQVEQTARNAMHNALKYWNALRMRWAEAANSIYTRANAIKEEHKNLLNQYNQKIGQMERDTRATQLNEYLRSQRISTASISGIGPARQATLRSWGIETAAEISGEALMGVPGFGMVMSTNLFEWRKSCERRFRFDPRKGIPVAARRSAAIHVLQRQRSLETSLEACISEMERINYKFKLQLDEASKALISASAAFDHAAANLKAVDDFIRRF